jgi:hypothetical protein
VETNGKPKQEACDDPECYHLFPEHIIFRDIQRGSVPDEALRKSCVWSRICEVRWKYRHKIGIHSDAWNALCTRMGTVRHRTGWFTPLVVREPLLEALQAARDKASR